MAGLSRDTDNAHQGVDISGNVQKIRDDLAVQTEGAALGASALDLYGKYAEQEAVKSNRALEAKLEAEGKLDGMDTADRDAFLKTQPGYSNTDYGPGSDYWTKGSAVAGLLAGALGGNLQGGAAAGAAPLLASLVKQANNSAEVRAVLHGIVAAALAQVAGGSSADGMKAGAVGAITATLISERLVHALYNKDASELTADEKRLISNLVSIAGAGAGYAVGGDVSTAALGANAARVEVENNSLSVKQNQDRAKEMTQCQGDACDAVIEKYKKLNAEQHKSVVNCSGAQDCVDKANEVGQLMADYANRANELMEKGRVSGSLSPEEQNELSILKGTSIQLEADRTAAIRNALMSGDSQEAKQLAINSLAQIAGTSAAGVAAGIGKGNVSSGAKSPIVPGGGLAAHEKAGGHLIERHVGKTEAELLSRVSTGNVKTASSFTDRATAEAVVGKTIDSNQSAIQSYLSGSQKGYLELNYQSSSSIGISVTQGSTSVTPTTNARVIIGRDPSMPNGYKIITGYPVP